MLQNSKGIHAATFAKQQQSWQTWNEQNLYLQANMVRTSLSLYATISRTFWLFLLSEAETHHNLKQEAGGGDRHRQNIHGKVSELVPNCSIKVLRIMQNHRCSPRCYNPQPNWRSRRYRRRRRSSNLLGRTQCWSLMLAITPRQRSHQGRLCGHQNPSSFQGPSRRNLNPFPISWSIFSF